MSRPRVVSIDLEHDTDDDVLTDGRVIASETVTTIRVEIRAMETKDAAFLRDTIKHVTDSYIRGIGGR